MTRERIGWLGLAAAAATGAVCSLLLPFLVLAFSGDLEQGAGGVQYLILLWPLVGLWLGIAAGLVLGVVPTLVAAYLWSDAEGYRELRRRVGVMSIGVAVVAMAEVVPFALYVVLASADASGQAPDVWSALVAATVVGVVSGSVFWVVVWPTAEWTVEEESQPTWPPAVPW